MENFGKINLTKLAVDCVNNDPVDIRCGGPKYLGFDFFVRPEKKVEMSDFIQKALDLYRIPLMKISEVGEYELPRNCEWSRLAILTEIDKDSERLIAESQRSYNKTASK